MNKINQYILFIMFLAAFLPQTANAGLFNSCKYLPEEPRPKWTESGYEKSGYYLGVGFTDKKKKMEFKEFQDDSQQDALSTLVQSISITVESTFEKTQRVVDGDTKQNEISEDVKITSKIKADQLLRDVKFKDEWLDRKNCRLWTLAQIKKSTLNRIKAEVVMKDRVEKFEALILSVMNKKDNSIYDRKLSLDNATAIFEDIDFAIVPSKLPRKFYLKKLNVAIESIKKELRHTQGKTLIAAIVEDEDMPQQAVNSMIDFVYDGVQDGVRLNENCLNINDCFNKATGRGFVDLVVLNIKKEVEISDFGTYNGSLLVDKITYNVESRRIINGPKNAFVEVIGWSEEELDWTIASKKIIESGLIKAGK